MVVPSLALALIAVVETSDSEDHFSDAKSAPVSPARSSPVLRTRIEKVDDEPSRGQVPGSEAHRQREEDVKPDEIALAADSTSPGRDQAPLASDLSSSETSESHAAPQTVISQSAGATSAHTETFNEAIEEAHREDAAPAVVIRAASTAEDAGKSDPNSVEHSAISLPYGDMQGPGNNGADEGKDGGDDFDEFEEAADDDDFDDFEDGFQQPESAAPVSHDGPPPAPAPQPTISFPFVGYSYSLRRSPMLTLEPGHPRLRRIGFRCDQ